MTKKYYQILEISETATSGEIRKAYQKLALKYHPDRNRSPDATEKMQEINRAYGVLSNEELRKRYDAGETNFSEDYSNEFSEEEAKLEELKERINLMKELVESEQERISLMSRMHAISLIWKEMEAAEIYSHKLDSKLWFPYEKWQDKVFYLEVIFKESGGCDEVNSPLYKFMNEMITAIRKRREEWKNGINNPYVDKTRTNAIESIENRLQEKGLNVDDLDEQYQNYKEQINNLSKAWKINAFRDRIKVHIYKKVNKNGERLGKGLKEHVFFGEEKFRNYEPPKNRQGEYENLTREGLIKKKEELEAEIRELKQEKPKVLEVSEYRSYIREKEAKLEECNLLLNSSSQEKKSTSDKKFPTGIFVGGGIIILFLVVLLIRRRKRNRY